MPKLKEGNPGKHTPLRSIRIDDKTWERAKRVAQVNHTTVSAIIVGYLKGLQSNSTLKPSQMRTPGLTNVEGHERRGPRRPKTGPDPEVARQLQEECDHDEESKGRKTVLNLVFCATCGKQLS